MTITFHGAARTVTGSKHLITLNDGRQILLDCGFFQGRGADTDSLNRHFGFDPSKIDFLILSHAHIDHSGNIPNLVKQGFEGKIICTAATRDLCAIMLADSAHIQEYDVKYLNKKRERQNKAALKPIYTIKDVAEAMNFFHTIPFNKVNKIDDGIQLEFSHSGHILGAAGVNLTITEKNHTKRIFFTGDIGRPNDKILKRPQAFHQTDYLICESTYGNRLHDDPEKTEKRLLEIVTETCVTNRGKLIIPAFSLGRTQEIVFALNNLYNKNKLPKIKVYVDSPLAISATGIMQAHTECFNDHMKELLHDDPNPFGFENLHYVRKAEDSIRLNDSKEPMIIISASGMAEAGRVKHHIRNNIENPKNTILIVGYCTPDSLGGVLVNKATEVSIFGKKYPVKAKIEVLNSYSAHADYEEMLQYLSCQDPSKIRKTFLVHGDYDVQHSWRERLMENGFKNIEIPEVKSSWNLD
ncbi:MAG: MBL fold metallo-hydrolase [Bacteroidetes bacterium]|nr:MAG: MBL fold metallo-hydrolase [Bacteroidota bacterium]